MDDQFLFRLFHSFYDNITANYIQYTFEKNALISQSITNINFIPIKFQVRNSDLIVIRYAI